MQFSDSCFQLDSPSLRQDRKEMIRWKYTITFI